MTLFVTSLSKELPFLTKYRNQNPQPKRDVYPTLQFSTILSKGLLILELTLQVKSNYSINHKLLQIAHHILAPSRPNFPSSVLILNVCISLPHCSKAHVFFLFFKTNIYPTIMPFCTGTQETPLSHVQFCYPPPDSFLALWDFSDSQSKHGEEP